MSHPIVEMASFKLKPGADQSALIAASNTFQENFLKNAEGFLRRELLRLNDTEYLDLIHWRSEADAAAMMEQASRSPECASYFSVMDMDGANPGGGVRHYVSLATYA